MAGLNFDDIAAKAIESALGGKVDAKTIKLLLSIMKKMDSKNPDKVCEFSMKDLKSLTGDDGFDLKQAKGLVEMANKVIAQKSGSKKTEGISIVDAAEDALKLKFGKDAIATLEPLLKGADPASLLKKLF